ncbi:putative reverse transcriptase domain-containing protein [Tanacetum coccineum]
MYLKEVVTRHGIPVSIICDRDPRFASSFWRSLQKALGTNLDMKLVQETTEKIIQIKQRMQVVRDRQKSYANLKCKPMEFQVGDKVMLKVLERVGDVAYKLDLLEELNRVHNTFHVRWNSRRGPEFTWERKDHSEEISKLFTKTAPSSIARLSQRTRAHLMGGD